MILKLAGLKPSPGLKLKMSVKILLLPGDGIGPEVIEQSLLVLKWFSEHKDFEFELKSALVGGAAYDVEGMSITPETIELAKASDAVLFGAVGGSKWDKVPYEHRPEAALLTLRKELELFANLRPAICFSALADASSLKKELVEGLDILIVRELTGGVYFGEPRGIKNITENKRLGINTHSYDSDEIKRIAEIAFGLAKTRRSKIMSVEKRNVMEAGQLWFEEVSAVAKNYPEIELNHMLADNCAMQLVRAPKQFDIILTDNLFGDILSDIAAQLTGSLGMLPSASMGAIGVSGKRLALYEPVHGSAPDIAGLNKANPLAMILSLAMMFRYSFNLGGYAEMIEEAVNEVLSSGKRTADIASVSQKIISTKEMGQAVIDQLNKNL